MPPTMNVPVLLAPIAVFVGILALVLFVRPGGGSDSGTRVRDYLDLKPTEGDASIALTNRRHQNTSAVEHLLARVSAIAPRKLRATAAAELASARVKLNANVFLGVRVVLLIAALVGASLWLASSPQKGIIQWGGSGAAILVALRLPSMWLKRRVKKNKREIEHAIPYALDLMVACLEGGLSLEATLDKVSSDSDTLLADEIRITLAEIALGRPSAEALRELGERTGAPDLKRLTESVVQAERMGVSIAEAMRTLAEEARARRRQHAEVQARKAPIKMLPVLVLCTLPAIAVIFLTPAMINISRAMTIFHR